MFTKEIDSTIKLLAEASLQLTTLKFRLKEHIIDDAPLDLSELRRRAALFFPADSQKNIKVQNRQPWSKKEVEKMPYLKDLKYRITVDGIHQFRYRRDGFNKSFNSKSYEVAKKKAYDFIFDLKKVLRDKSTEIHGTRLDEVARAWLALKAAHSDKKTAAVYRGVYNNHIAPVFGQRAVKSILPMHLQPFFNDLFERQPRTCEDAKTILNGVFRYAVANRLCPSNVMDGVIVEKHVRTPGKALTNEQIEHFKQTMLKDQTPFGLAGLIILYTGIRGAEFESLTFNWTAGTWSVKNAKLKKSQKRNEGNLYRTVPIFPNLWKLRERIETEDWKIKAATLSSKWCNHFSECTIKDLRHTFATKAREAGVENELVNLWTGHLPGKNVTANIYTHFSMDFQKQEAQKLTNY